MKPHSVCEELPLTDVCGAPMSHNLYHQSYQDGFIEVIFLIWKGNIYSL